MSLRQRLLIRSALVLGLSFFIGVALDYLRSAGKVRTELHAALTVGEKVLVDAVEEIQHASNPDRQIRVVIERFSGGRHLKVTLLDSRGRRVIASRLAMPDSPAPEWFYASVGGTPETARVNLPPGLGDFSFFLIEADPRNEVQEFWEDLGNGLAVLAILAALVLALIYRTLGRELKPLEELNKALSRVAEGDFSMRLAGVGSVDLRNVSQGFNHMASRLEQIEASNTRLQEQIANVQEEERAELARDLHDDIGPLLFSVGMDSASLKAMMGPTPTPEVQERLDSIREAVSLSQKHVLQILGRLRGGTVEDLGLQTAVRRLTEFWKSRRPAVAVQADIPESGVGVELDAIAYRVVQESLSNAMRHGQPTKIDVHVTEGQDGAVRVTVCDDGGGLKSQRIGHGLTGMRERIATRNGFLSIRNRGDGKGTLVVAEFPARRASASYSQGQSAGGVAV